MKSLLKDEFQESVELQIHWGKIITESVDLSYDLMIELLHPFKIYCGSGIFWIKGYLWNVRKGINKSK